MNNHHNQQSLSRNPKVKSSIGDHISQLGANLLLPERLKEGLDFRTRVFFVLTDRCLSIKTEKLCNSKDLGDKCFALGKAYSFAFHKNKKWDIGRRLLKTIALEDFYVNVGVSLVEQEGQNRKRGIQ
jgi:hypothetical protein